MRMSGPGATPARWAECLSVLWNAYDSLYVRVHHNRPLVRVSKLSTPPLLAILLLAGCGGTAPIVVKPQEANIAVATTCVDTVPAAPALLAADEWAKTPPDEFARTKALKIDRARLLQANDELRATLKACAVKP